MKTIGLVLAVFGMTLQAQAAVTSSGSLSQASNTPTVEWKQRKAGIIERVVIDEQALEVAAKEGSYAIGYLGELAQHHGCYRGDADVVLNKILLSHDAVDHYGDEVCDLGRIEGQGTSARIVFECHAEDSGNYLVAVSQCQ